MAAWIQISGKRLTPLDSVIYWSNSEVKTQRKGVEEAGVQDGVRLHGSHRRLKLPSGRRADEAGIAVTSNVYATLPNEILLGKGPS
ncbi:hypothetical protein HU200_047516 [Digitaria exilis]|uniref:Uncharacterized protein n=1 Tax=Digitaria exilis TaxID=1010633 RepID=A0A835EBT7_9POAL|nr:hypothetical protein HU200_047516 [Digitaria exilis]